MTDDSEVEVEGRTSSTLSRPSRTCVGAVPCSRPKVTYCLWTSTRAGGEGDLECGGFHVSEGARTRPEATLKSGRGTRFTEIKGPLSVEGHKG